MKDKYDEQIERLTKNPARIKDEWSDAIGIFDYAERSYGPWSDDCGCLTMIRSGGGYRAQTEELTKAIRADKRIPKRDADIKPEHLPVFAEWQRRIDKELNRA
jgi:hypothetical protein